MSNFEPTIEEVLDIIYDINNDMPEELLDLGMIPLSISAMYNGECDVKFLGNCIWDTESDKRDYMVDEQMYEIDEKEDLKQHLKAQMKNIAELILEGLSDD